MAEWRASGLTSTAFCAGRDFTPGGLRNAAHHVEQGARRGAKSRSVRVARVLRKPSAAMELATVTEVTLTPPAPSEAAVVVEIGAARMRVARGFDRETFAAVVAVLDARGAA